MHKSTNEEATRKLGIVTQARDNHATNARLKVEYTN